MGVKFEHGRNFLATEDVRGNNFVVILKPRFFWQRGRSVETPAIIGKIRAVGGTRRAYTVVGVLFRRVPLRVLF